MEIYFFIEKPHDFTQEDFFFPGGEATDPTPANGWEMVEIEGQHDLSLAQIFYLIRGSLEHWEIPNISDNGVVSIVLHPDSSPIGDVAKLTTPLYDRELFIRIAMEEFSLNQLDCLRQIKQTIRLNVIRNRRLAAA